MSNNPLSLNTDQLAQRFRDLQEPDQAGWNDKNKQALYFTSAGSEYRLWYPEWRPTAGPIPQEAVTRYLAALDEAEDWVNANLTGSAQAEQLVRIAAARNELSSGTDFPILQIKTTIDHIRGGALDDHAAVQIDVFWSEALQTWLPADIQMGFTWATATQEVPPNLMQRLPLPPPFPMLIRSVLKKIPVVGWVIQLVDITRTAIRVWNVVVSIIAKMSDDGGRLYFPTVVSEAVARILQSINPSTSAQEGTLTTPDLMRLKRQWVATYEASVYQSGGSYRYFVSQIPYTYNDGSSDYYSVTLPDLIYLPGGAGTLLSFKMTLDGEKVFAAITLLLSSDGALQMASGTSQFSNGDTYTAEQTWVSPTENASQILYSVAQTLFNEDNVPMTGPRAGEIAMKQVLFDYMTSLVSSHRALSVSSANPFSALPPLPSVNFGSATSINTDKKRPAVYVASSGYGVTVCVDTSGGDALYEASISTSSTAISVYSRQTSAYQGGQDPALSSSNGSTIVEVHGGNGNNKLYDNLIKLSGSSVTLPDDGSQYDKGENPAVAVVGSYAYEFHRDQNAGSTTLYYEVGSISSDSIDWGSSSNYGSGDNVFACPCPGKSNLVIAHDRGGTIYTRNATVSGKSISFTNEAALGEGEVPAVAVLSNNFVLVFHQGTGDSDSTLCASIGLWSTSSIQWIVTGVRAFAGTHPGASRRADDTTVVVYESGDDISGRVASLSIPAGFV
ncbi:hypothetical protein [Dyella sp.]|uniref:hypothetical protein n=1 Tax=Dyella sp. TaxID=1869338 RepID=UPI002ED24802